MLPKEASTMTEEIDLSLNITVAAAWISSWLDGLLFVIFFRFLRRLVAFDVMSKTHRWVIININLQLFSDCQKKPVNIEEKAVFRAVNPPAAGSPCVPFRDFREDYSDLIPTLHPTAFIA